MIGLLYESCPCPAFSLRPQLVSGSSLVQAVDCAGNPTLSRLGGLGSFNQEDEAPAVAVGQRVEESPCDRITFESGREVGGDGHLADLGVEFDVRLDLIARSDTGPLADLRTDSDHERSAERSHGTAVRVAVDRDADRRPFARP